MNDKNQKPKSRKKRLDIEIREMEIDDIATVFHMGEKIFTSEDAPNLYRTWDEYEVINLFQSNSEYCLVAEHKEIIVGFVLGTTVTKQRSAWKYGILVWLGVHPDYMGRRVATRLFRHFQSLMKEEGARILLMDTEADNEPAIQFFEKFGFGNVEEHIYMSKNLSKRKRKPKKNNRKKKD